MKSRLTNESGMTVIEIALVIVLLGILVYATWPASEPGAPSMALDTARKQIMSDLRYAQSLAVTTGKPHALKALSATTYEVINIDTGQAVKSPLTQLPLHEDLSDSFGQVILNNAPFDILFDGLGKPAAGTDQILSITSGTQTVGIKVSGQSGHIGNL